MMDDGKISGKFGISISSKLRLRSEVVFKFCCCWRLEPNGLSLQYSWQGSQSLKWELKRVPGDLETEAIKFPTPQSTVPDFRSKRLPESNRSIPSLLGSGCTVHCSSLPRTVRCIHARTPFKACPHCPTALKSSFSSNQPIRGGDSVWGYAHSPYTDQAFCRGHLRGHFLRRTFRHHGRSRRHQPLPVGGRKPIFRGGRLGGRGYRCLWLRLECLLLEPGCECYLSGGESTRYGSDMLTILKLGHPWDYPHHQRPYRPC